MIHYHLFWFVAVSCISTSTRSTQGSLVLNIAGASSDENGSGELVGCNSCHLKGEQTKTIEANMTALNVYLKVSVYVTWLTCKSNRISWTKIKKISIFERINSIPVYMKKSSFGSRSVTFWNFIRNVKLLSKGQTARHMLTLRENSAWNEMDVEPIMQPWRTGGWRWKDHTKTSWSCKETNSSDKGEISKTGTCHWRVDSSGFLLSICCGPWVHLGCWNMVICQKTTEASRQ